MAPRWRKVLSDLWSNKLRSLLVITAITIGVYAVGMITACYVIISEDMNASYAATSPASALFFTDAYSQDYLERLRKNPEIREVEGLTSFTVSLKIGPDEWKPLQLTASPDFAGMKINKILPTSGKWPAGNHELLLEGSTLALSNAKVGDVVQVKLPDGALRTMPVVGVVHDEVVNNQGITVFGYVTYDSLEWLGQGGYFNRLYMTVAEKPADKAHIQAVADRLSDQLRSSNIPVYYMLVPEPGEHPAAQQVKAILGVLVIMGLLAMFLGGFLVTNTLSALLTQHIRQIGVMKAVGARTSQIMGMYLVLIFLYGFISLVISAPLGAYSAYGAAQMVSLGLNFRMQPFRIIPAALALQIIIAFGVPLVAGIIPVLAGSRITIREAISGYGLASPFGKGLIDRILERIRFLSRPMSLSLRNTFRRKGRLFLTLTTLILGGAIFISIFTVRTSMMMFVERASKYFLSDVNVSLDRAYTIHEVEQVVIQVPGIQRVEGWAGAAGELLRDDNTGIDTVQIMAPPADSELIEPVMQQGRWIMPGDENAITLSTAFWKKLPNVKPGDTIRIKIGERKTTWHVVGIFQFPNDQQLIAYSNYDYVSRLVSGPNRSGYFRIVTRDHSPAFQAQASRQIETVLRSRGFNVIESTPGSTLIQSIGMVINMLVTFFLVMSILIAMVGSVGLTATMSMNVLERTREIGVMRAIGASTGAVLRLVLVEGVLIGLISWALGALLSLPLSATMFNIVNLALFRTPGEVVYSADGFIIWLVAVVVLSSLASLLPALNAARLTVRDVLVYE